MKKLPQRMIAALAFVSLCSGCQTGPPLNTINVKSLGPIACTFDPEGKKQPRYESVTAEMWGELGWAVPGLIPGLIAIGVTSTVRGFGLGAGQAELDRVSQSLGGMECPLISKTVEARLKRTGYDMQPGAPAVFTIKLYSYGVIKGRKELAVGKVAGRVILTDSAHRELWRGEVAGYSAEGHTMEEYLGNPELYRKVLQTAADNFARTLPITRNKATLPD